MKQVDEEIPLLAAVPMMQRIVYSCRDKSRFPYTRTQLYIFTMLSLRGSVTMKQVAEFISTSREQATRAVAPLVDDGYVERYTLPDNRLHVHLRLTEKGQAYFSQLVDDLSSRINDKLDQLLSDDDKADLKSAVHTIIRVLGNVEVC